MEDKGKGLVEGFEVQGEVGLGKDEDREEGGMEVMEVEGKKEKEIGREEGVELGKGVDGEEGGTDLMEVVEVEGEKDREIGKERRVEDDLGSKVLTEKMVYLMGRIAEYGYLSMPEVELVYANQTHAYRVLGVLRNKDLIGDFLTERRPKKAYYLRPKGYRTLEKYGALRLKRRFLPQGYKAFIFNHRMACAKVGLILEGHPLVKKFMPESLLWERAVSRRQKLCDGEFEYQVPGEKAERVGLEVELTLKNRDMLDESLRALKDRADLKQVWWVCGDMGIVRALAAEVTRRPRLAPQRHFFCTLEDFLAVKHQVRLRDHAGAEFKIDPEGPTLRAHKPAPPPPAPLPRVLPVAPPVARAEALAEPEPALELVPRTHWAWRLCRLLWRAVAGLGRWVGAPWRKKHPFDESLWERLWYFPHWPKLCLGMVLTLGLGTFFLTKAPENAPPPTKRLAKKPTLWRKQRLVRTYFSALNGWMVDKVSLHSRGLHHRLGMEVVNLQSVPCGLRNAVISDSRRRRFKSWDLTGHWTASQSGTAFDLDFEAPPQEKEFWLEVRESGANDCLNFEVQIEVR